LDRARTWHASRNCFIRIDGDAALDAARERDRELERGQRRGALHGVPLAHKDMFYRAGKFSTGGSPILQDQIATTPATGLQRLEGAGAIKTGVLTCRNSPRGRRVTTFT